MEIKEIAIKDLKPWGKNPRKHDVDALAKSIEHFGFRSPIVVNRTAEGYVVEAGHGRLKAAQKVGLKTIPCLIVEDDEAKAAAFALADNKLQERTEWLMPGLKDILQELDTGAFDMGLTGFSEEEIENLMVGAKLPEFAIDLKPRTMLRILISVPLDSAIRVKELVEQIAALPETEVDYGSN